MHNISRDTPNMLIWLSASGGHFLPTPIRWTHYFFLLLPHNQLHLRIVKLDVKFGVSIALLESYRYKVKQILRQSKDLLHSDF